MSLGAKVVRTAAKMMGIDRWGKEYASFSLPLCQSNAKETADCRLFFCIEAYSNLGIYVFLPCRRKSLPLAKTVSMLSESSRSIISAQEPAASTPL